MNYAVVRTKREDIRLYASVQPGQRTPNFRDAKVFTDIETAHSVARLLTYEDGREWEVADADPE